MAIIILCLARWHYYILTCHMINENQRALSGSLDSRPMALGFRFTQCTPDITKAMHHHFKDFLSPDIIILRTLEHDIIILRTSEGDVIILSPSEYNGIILRTLECDSIILRTLECDGIILRNFECNVIFIRTFEGDIIISSHRQTDRRTDTLKYKYRFISYCQ